MLSTHTQTNHFAMQPLAPAGQGTTATAQPEPADFVDHLTAPFLVEDENGARVVWRRFHGADATAIATILDDDAWSPLDDDDCASLTPTPCATVAAHRAARIADATPNTATDFAF
jgi:hypothetical protein